MTTPGGEWHIPSSFVGLQPWLHFLGCGTKLQGLVSEDLNHEGTEARRWRLPAWGIPPVNPSLRSASNVVGCRQSGKQLTFTKMETAKVIQEGDCQTVRLPKGFHIATATVGIRHDGEAIVLEPLKPKAWPAGFFEAIHITDPEFSRPDQGQLPQVRPV